MRGEVVIAGIGNTSHGRHPDRDTVSLNVEACRRALADAAVDKDAVDAVFVKTPSSAREFMYGQKVSEALGLQPRIAGAWDQGGAANITLLTFAAMAIMAGQCEIALVCYADNPKTGNSAHFARPRGNDAAYGWFSTAAGYAMIHRSHIEAFGTAPDAFASVAIACRRHGAANPQAQLRAPLTLDAYMASPYVVEPLRRDDCCLISDGGAAVVVMSARRARELGVAAPVPILGFGHGQVSCDLQSRSSLTRLPAVEGAAHRVFEMAGLSTRQIDVAQIYDCFTITVLATLEAYGFCGHGQSGRFVRDGALEIGGALPVNTAGGLLSETGMPGLQLILEGVRQMRGMAHTQVRGAKHCLVTNQGGTMHTHSSLILGA